MNRQRASFFSRLALPRRSGRPLSPWPLQRSIVFRGKSRWGGEVKKHDVWASRVAPRPRDDLSLIVESFTLALPRARCGWCETPTRCSRAIVTRGERVECLSPPPDCRKLPHRGNFSSSPPRHSRQPPTINHTPRRVHGKKNIYRAVSTRKLLFLETLWAPSGVSRYN